MAFWGIEVKPGKPITHSCENARGRLRISLASLGFTGAAKKTVVQCNVGNRIPVVLCSLLPNKIETCNIGLEFEEADDVVFSVIGPRTVYLSGHYVLKSQQSNANSDTESYGVDIENSHTEGSSYNSDDGDDKYEDSFIDDDGLQVSPNSPVKGMDEPTPEIDKTKGRKGRGKLFKKNRVIESDNDANSHESQDEDEDEAAYTLFSFKTNGAAKTTVSDAEEKIAKIVVEMGDESNDDGVCGTESKQSVDPLDINDNLERETKLPLDEEGVDVKNEIPKETKLPLDEEGVDVKNEIPKEVETLEENIVSNEEVLTGDASLGNNVTDTIKNQDSLMSNGKDQMQSVDLCGTSAKPKKKRKRRSVRQEKTCEVQTGDEDSSVLGEDKEHEVDASTDLEIGANSLATPQELDSVDGKKPRKKRNVLQSEGIHTEGLDEKCQDIPEEDKHDQSLLHSDSLTKEKCHDISEEDKHDQGLLHTGSVMDDLPVANGESQEQQRLEETSAEGIGGKCPNIPKEDKLEQGVVHAESLMKDQPAANGEYREQQIDNNTATIQSEKKTKKKRKKTQGWRESNTNVTEMTGNEETAPVKYDEQTSNTVSIQRRTLSNGLIIEELASGPPNGKVAAPGKKVKFHYTGMLKESGLVFDSNVGKNAFKFRLGDEEYIDGWNVGIDGMRVGDKRRLIIPPSMGFGDHGIGENVPPKSWLVYDVELVSVRK